MRGLNGRFELIVEAAGMLLLPVEIAAGLRLAPGDLLLLEAGPCAAYVGLEIYHELLADDWQALSAENRWSYLKEFLSRPLTALDSRGALPIPEEIFPLVPGATIGLQVMSLGLVHRLFVYENSRR
jgi:hypothetical protein